MFIKELKIENYKCFKNKEFKNLAVPNGKRGSGLNILIGKNNSGKTTFLTTFLKLIENNPFSNNEKNDLSKEIKIVFVDNKGKEKIIKTNDSSNPSGDSKLSFDNSIDFIKDNKVWSTEFSNPQNFAQYSNYKKFNMQRDTSDIHLAAYLASISRDEEKKKEFDELILSVIPDLNNWTANKFRENSSFIFDILKDGREIPADISFGMGILNLFKIVASLVNEKDIIIIDEPEAFLYPIAQEKLLDLFLSKSTNKQIFIATHSPYMFKNAIRSNMETKLFVFKKNKNNEEQQDDIKIESYDKNNSFSLFPWGPTWGEINWFAYNLPTVEFHDELYGFLQEKAIKENEDNCFEKKFNKWLKEKLENKKEVKWVRDGKVNEVVIQIYIRNFIHHPENKENEKYSDEDFSESIEEMIKIVKKE